MGYEWEPARDEKGNVVGLEIEFFDDDPDGDEDRAGDGYYFRWSDKPEAGWSGAWHSEDEAEREAIEERAQDEWIAAAARDRKAMQDYLSSVPGGDGIEVASFRDHPDSPAQTPDEEQSGYYFRLEGDGPWTGPAETWSEAAKAAVEHRDAALAETSRSPAR